MTPYQRETVIKWIEALRSGQYKQNKHYLEYNGCNCCIGVLARITNVTPVETDHEEPKIFNFGGEIASETPPDTWFTQVTGFDELFMSELMTHNDNDGLSFESIADIIDLRLQP